MISAASTVRAERGTSDPIELACGCGICSGAKIDWLEPVSLLIGDTAAVSSTDEGDSSVEVGGSFYGEVNTEGDTDLVTVTLEAGKTYMISLRGTGDTPLLDPFLQLADPNGAPLGNDDDGGTYINSLMNVTTLTAGDYQITAGALPATGGIGGYTVDVREMGADSVPGNLTSTVALPTDGNTFGFIETMGDKDVYAVTLTAGSLYSFEVGGGADHTTNYLAVPPGELDTKLTLFDADGNQVAFSDDINFSPVPGEGDISSAIGYSALTTGTYYLQVEAYESNAGGGTGGYALKTAEVDLTALDPVDSIDWGTKLASNDVTVYFAGPGEVYDGVASLGWTDYEIEKAMEAFGTWADITNLTFTHTTDADTATFKLVTTASADYLGYFNPPGTENAGVGVFSVAGTGWDRVGTDGGLEQGGYGFITLIHEFGHGIGLSHPHDNGGTSQIMAGVTGPFDSYGAYDLNQGVYSTMSYNDGWQTHPDADENGEIPDAPTAWGFQGGPGAFDISVAQAKYGADSGRNSGDTVYVLPTENVAGTFWTAVYDVSGTDTIAHGGTVSALIDLTAATLDYSATGAGVISYVDGIFGGFTIAGGTVIENATGGSAADVLVGNAAANLLNGGGGADTLIGRNGNDVYRVDAAGDQVTEASGEGEDRVTSSVTYTLGAGVHVETLGTVNAASTTALSLTGNELANSVYGNAGGNALNGGGANDLLVGLAGNDILYGGAGADNLRGGLGDDVYRMDDAADMIFEGSAEGSDRVSASTSYTLNAGAAVETLVTNNGAATVALSLTGNEVNNSIYANAGDNVLSGGGGSDSLHGLEGKDTLKGGAGLDNLRGGAGEDNFLFDTALGAGNVDRIWDFAVADDTIQLDDAMFAGLGLGGLAAGAFATGAAASDADDRIIYNSATGALLFDADGNLAGAAVHFATLDPALAVSAADFAVI